jgi:hypothetical protein
VTETNSFSKLYKKRSKQVVSKPWFNPNNDPKLNEIFKKNAVAIGASENTVVQPYWRKKIKEINDSLDPSLTVTLVDTHGTPTIGTRKPGIISVSGKHFRFKHLFFFFSDISGKVKEKPLSPFYIALVGEVKAGRTGLDEFTNEEKGQLDSFLYELLRLQPQRQQATGFLTDGRIIQFFRLTHKEGYLLEETPVYYLHDDGGAYLLGLLRSSPLSLGLPETELMCDKLPVIIQDVLGIGGTATVYQGDYQKERDPVVVKVFRTPKGDGFLEREVNALKRVKSLQPDVPRIVGISDSQTALLLTPVGMHFRHSSKNHQTSLPLASRYFNSLERKKKKKTSMPVGLNFLPLLT